MKWKDAEPGFIFWVRQKSNSHNQVRNHGGSGGHSWLQNIYYANHMFERRILLIGYRKEKFQYFADSFSTDHFFKAKMDRQVLDGPDGPS